MRVVNKKAFMSQKCHRYSDIMRVQNKRRFQMNKVEKNVDSNRAKKESKILDIPKEKKETITEEQKLFAKEFYELIESLIQDEANDD